MSPVWMEAASWLLLSSRTDPPNMMCLCKGLANSSGTTPGWVGIDTGPWPLAAQASDGFQAADTVQVTNIPATCEDKVSSRGHIRRADLGSPGQEAGLRGHWALAQKRVQVAAASPLASLTGSFFCSFHKEVSGTFYEDTKIQETVSVLKGLNQ